MDSYRSSTCVPEASDLHAIHLTSSIAIGGVQIIANSSLIPTYQQRYNSVTETTVAVTLSGEMAINLRYPERYALGTSKATLVIVGIDLVCKYRTIHMLGLLPVGD